MYRIKPWEDLTIQDDYMFKLIMSRKRICKKMLEKLLQIPIRDIKYIDVKKDEGTLRKQGRAIGCLCGG